MRRLKCLEVEIRIKAANVRRHEPVSSASPRKQRVEPDPIQEYERKKK